MIYLDYTQAELDAQYNQATKVADISPYVEYWTRAGEAARAKLTCTLDVAYGEGDVERLDIFPTSEENAPVHIHLHGGAWHQLGKEHVSYPAPHFVSAGATFIAVNFGLAPEYALGDIVDQTRKAIKWIWQNSASFGGDADRLFISGVSSGAHLAANVLADDWRDAYGLSENLIKGAVLASGPYDLDPVRLSARNEYLHLDQAAADHNNPLKHIPAPGPEIFVCWGDGELDEFQRQGRDFAAAWQAAGHNCQTLQLENRNHFDVGNEFGRGDSTVINAALAQMDLN
ncbi:MAG: alpha/beta hydrolase [Rhodospirillaceae bacterium]|nr:alpha/beta hydrolase [Rhodospirillaceae bacterium]MBT4940553.1 alpha/beta hydrolase [Rhodospirillaceae bacterium]MBT5938731.1 alpha/beta hydrolase [Rhodospirillaceae bacterium]MBT7265428.1 alpha/beta hydrolase [Rhodospirillaceae bacterium]